MNTFVYAGVVAAGALTLLIEAHRNFNSSLTTIPFKEHPILKNMRVEQLCTAREKTTGFLFYSLLYLVTYVVILSSTAIYDLVLQAQASGLAIGPVTTIAGQEDDPAKLLEGDYGKPIFISAAIIAIFSLGIMRPIEGTMRSLAHRLAGVPRGVYLIIEKLHGIPFDHFEVTNATPLTTMFEVNAQASFADSYDKDQIPVIKTALRTVDYLSPAITGKQRIQHFPFTQLEAMGAMSDALEQTVSRLRETLSKPLDGDDSKRRELFDMATTVANDTIALFSVHFLRNNRAIKNIGKGTAIALVEAEIRRDYQVETNSFAMGLLMAMVCTVGVAFGLVFHWQKISPLSLYESVNQATEAATSEAGLKTTIETTAVLAATVVANGGNLNDVINENMPKSCAMTYPAKADFLETTAARTGQEATEGLSDACERAWVAAGKEARVTRLERVTVNALRQPLPVAVAVALAALAAIFGREIRREDNSWPVWRLRRPPFVHIIIMSLVPGLLAILGITAASFLQLWFEADFKPTQNQIAFFFSSKWIYFLGHFLIGFVVSAGVLSLSDQHQRLKLPGMLLIGLFFGCLALLAYYVVVIIGYADAFRRDPPMGVWPWLTFPLRETLIYGSLPALFLVFYALWLEITEAKPTDSDAQMAYA